MDFSILAPRVGLEPTTIRFVTSHFILCLTQSLKRQLLHFLKLASSATGSARFRRSLQPRCARLLTNKIRDTSYSISFGSSCWT